MEKNHVDNIFDLLIEGEGREYLKTASFWARIVAIIGFISVGLSLISAFTTWSKYGALVGVTTFVGVCVSGGVSIILNVFLLRFGSNISKALAGNSQGEFNTGIDGLRRYFKVFGILLIICMALAVLAILAQFAGMALLRK